MFDHGICAHLIRISLIDSIALPGMEAHIQLISKKREKLQKLADTLEVSDEEFEANLNLLEMQSGTQISESVQPNVAITPNVVSNTPDVIPQYVTNPTNVAIPPKKRGRKKRDSTYSVRKVSNYSRIKYRKKISKK